MAEESEVVRPIPPELVAEAKRYPGGWVYEIEGHYDPDQAVPPEAIVGGWRVSDAGEVTGEFVRNPNYRGRKKGDSRGEGNRVG